MKLKTIYIAGPMRGYSYYNFEAFFRAELRLLRQGYRPLNPARMDVDSGFNAFNLEACDHLGVPEGFDLDACLRRDVDAIMESDAIYMLQGWQDSTGAKAELALAQWRHLEVIYEGAEPWLN